MTGDELSGDASEVWWVIRAGLIKGDPMMCTRLYIDGMREMLMEDPSAEWDAARFAAAFRELVADGCVREAEGGYIVDPPLGPDEETK